ncbi:MAG TPA: anthranilate phosphoribosyltransferase [Beijerinckiaceae bacterium]|jgi:anthranilate phosphoribosyltransferase|nr:anthranilate phosphoribosyltransferase [Beijerinckiaceae bacterium]
MDAFKPILAKVATGQPLSAFEAQSAFDLLLSGEVTHAQAGAFLMGLRVRGETVDEITGAVEAMRARMLRIEAPEGAIDVVGTGGDQAGTWNISTLASLIVAACGVTVAKHGNRAASSKSGAADVLGALGVKIGLDKEGLERCLNEAGIAFMFAPTHHASIRHVMPVRTEIGTRTLFNLLGPMSNPAGVKRQLVGVFAKSWTRPVAETLKALGSERVWVVCGSDSIDEITTTGPTHVTALENGSIREFEITPEEAGIALAEPEALKGAEAMVNAGALMRVLAGEKTAYRDIGMLNAAAALCIAGKAKNLAEGAKLAAQVLDDGAVLQTLRKLIAASNAAP